MRILYFAFVELDVPNACQTHTLGIIKGLCNNNCKVVAIIPLPKKVRPKISGANFIYFWPWRFSGLGKLWAKFLGGFYIFILCLLRRFDALYVRELEKNPFPRWCSKIFNIPLYVEINGLLIPESEYGINSNNHFRAIERNQKLDLNIANGLIIPSYPRAKRIIEKYNLLPQKVHIILNGGTIPKQNGYSRSLSLQKLNLPVDGFFLGFLGSVWKHYDLKSVIHAMNLCKTKISNLHLIIIGGGPNLQEIKKQARSEGLSSKIVDLGYIQPNNLYKVMNAIDVGLMNLTEEGLNDLGPITTRFATYAFYGIPAIGNTRYLENYPKEIIQGLYLIPPNDPSALADIILHIFNNPKERTEKSKILYGYATDKLTWDKVAKKICGIITRGKNLRENFLYKSKMQ